MNEALGTFLAEAREISERIESALLECEAGTAGGDTVNALFRAMHTLKGSAGLFGLDDIVAFAHVLETVLDRVRAGRVEMSSPLSSALLACRDHIDDMVRSISTGVPPDAAFVAAGRQLLDRVQSLGGVVAGPAEVRAAAPERRDEPRGIELPGVEGQRARSDCWHISVRPMKDVLGHGMDPLSILRYLGTFGTIAAIEVLDDALPPLREFDPQRCYVGIELAFRTSADRERIESAFEYVRDDCKLTILPPRARVDDYVRLINELPEAHARLGEILVRCGSLTQLELNQALCLQARSAVASSAAQRPLGEILIERRVVAPAVVEAAVQKQRQTREARAQDKLSLRVDAEKIEQLIDVVGELVIAGASTHLLAQRANSSDLSESAARLARLVEEVRDRTLKLRMTQIGATFGRFTRIVRDTARELGKDIRLETRGAETELDKTLIEKISDPLTHLVRNSIDHGIEAAAVRVTRGKPAQGVVRLNAYHDSGAVVIEVEDDGAGLDRERIFERALQRGLVQAGQQLSDADVHALIFEPGFTTAEKITDLSGRGVGMDVVRRNVTQLRGTIEVDSRAGQGMTVRIRLPLTLAIIDGFLVRVGRSAFVIPLESVEECIEAGAAGAAFADANHYIDLRGQALPCVRLSEHFRTQGAAARRQSIVVVRCAAQRVGLLVDELLGEHQIVIKPLPRVFQQVRGLAGSTILADGEVALIVDTPVLIAECRQRAQARGAAA